MTYTRHEENLIVLSSLTGIKYSIRSKYLSDYENSTQKLNEEEFLIKNIPDGVYNIVKSKFFDGGYRSFVLENLEKQGIECVTKFSPFYPAAFKELSNPPPILYCKGNKELLKSGCFTIVGSRKSTAQATALCTQTAEELSSVFTIVTGMAVGGDAAAIEGGLKTGKIISILANGIARKSPVVNAGYYDKVAKNGLLVSEYPPDDTQHDFYFHHRNRLLAAISRGLLVVSGGKGSGTLITANYAKQLGRDIFAFPYFPGVTSGQGCNNLIKGGARIAENAQDILSFYGVKGNEPQLEFSLDRDELEVYNVLRRQESIFISDLAAEVDKMPHELMPILTMLEMKGKLIRLGGNRFAAK